MANEPLQTCKLEIRTDSRLSVRIDQQAPQPVRAENGRAMAPAAGKAGFVFPIVLPAAAVPTEARLGLEVSGPAEVCVDGRSVARLQPGDPAELKLSADQLGPGRPLEIPELDYSDFCRRDLTVTVEPSGQGPGEIALSGIVTYHLPLETAAAYLTYVMTQA
jgi:hypothetical protein